MCLALGIAHPDFLQERLTASQWRDWCDYASVVPIGADRDDWRAAFTTANLAGCWADGVDVADFRINWLKPKRTISTPQQLEALAAAINARFEAK